MTRDKCKIEIYLIFFASKLFVCPVISSLGIKKPNKEWRLVSTSVRLEGPHCRLYNKTVSQQRRCRWCRRGRSEQWTESGLEPQAACNKDHDLYRSKSKSKSVLGVDGGAMHAIYQHRPDNEVPGRLPIVDDDRIAPAGCWIQSLSKLSIQIR